MTVTQPRIILVLISTMGIILCICGIFRDGVDLAWGVLLVLNTRSLLHEVLLYARPTTDHQE